MPSQISEFGVEVYHDMLAGLKDVDVVMMLRSKKSEWMEASFHQNGNIFNDTV